MKKTISQISLILLIITIGIMSTFMTKVNAAESLATISCASSVKQGESFKVTLNFPDNAYAASATIKVVFSDNTSKTEKMAYMKNMESNGFSNTVTFSATVAGKATINVSEIQISAEDETPIEKNGTKSKTITIESNKPAVENTAKPNTNTATTPSTGNQGGNTSNTGNSGNAGGSSNTGSSGNTDDKDATTNEEKFTTVDQTVYTTEWVNIINSNSTTSDKVDTVAANTELKRIGIGDKGWSKVEYKGAVAYVYTKYLVVKESDEEDKDVVFKDTNETLYAKSSCNLRKSWSTNSEKVGYLLKGQEVERTGYSENGWSRIKYNGDIVYVASRLLVIEKPEEDEELANNTVANNTVQNSNTVEDPTQMSEEDMLKEIQAEVGVLPEVGKNISDYMFLIVTLVALIGTATCIIYIKKIK